MTWWGFRCVHCHQPLAVPSHGFCCRCRKLLQTTPYCGGCGSPLPEDRLGCGHCGQVRPKWHRLVHVAPYRSPLSDWIHRFKFHQQYSLDHALGRLLLLAIKQAQRTHALSLPEVILPVPLFWWRQATRGYNQAALLARYLADKLQLPLDCQSLQRVKATRPQWQLTAQERQRNLQKAFVFRPRVPYRRVAVVDDVVTTGTTLNAICLALRQQGVEDIQVWALARA